MWNFCILFTSAKKEPFLKEKITIFPLSIAVLLTDEGVSVACAGWEIMVPDLLKEFY